MRRGAPRLLDQSSPNYGLTLGINYLWGYRAFRYKSPSYEKVYNPYDYLINPAFTLGITHNIFYLKYSLAYRYKHLILKLLLQ